MSPPLGRVEAALARREGRAPGMARYRGTARWLSRRTWIWAATGDTDIATPYEIVRLIGSRAFAGGAARRRAAQRAAPRGEAPSVATGADGCPGRRRTVPPPVGRARGGGCRRRRRRPRGARSTGGGGARAAARSPSARAPSAQEPLSRTI